MRGDPVKQVIILHAIPNAIGWGAAPVPQVFDVTQLPHEEQQKVQKALEARGYFVQVWFPQDPVVVLAEAEVRERLKQAEEARNGKVAES